MTLFAPVAACDCLYSTLRNMLNREAYYGFLPPHGRRLAAGEEVTVFGDIQHYFARQTPNDRGRRSLEAALCKNDPDIVIVKDPALHLTDLTTDDTKVIQLSGGTLSAVDACWGSYSSSAGGIGP
jgi:hypothetical protein